MGIEGAIGIRNINMRLLVTIGNDIDGPAQCIGSQANRYYALKNLDTLCIIDWNIIELKGGAKVIYRHAVDKELHLVALKAINGKVHARANPAAFAYPDTGNTVKGIAKVQRSGVQLFGIHNIYVKSFFFNFTQLTFPRNDDRLHFV